MLSFLHHEKKKKEFNIRRYMHVRDASRVKRPRTVGVLVWETEKKVNYEEFCTDGKNCFINSYYVRSSAIVSERNTFWGDEYGYQRQREKLKFR